MSYISSEIHLLKTQTKHTKQNSNASYEEATTIIVMKQNYDQHLWILMKLKYESYMYNEKKIARLTAEPEPYRTNATR